MLKPYPIYDRCGWKTPTSFPGSLILMPGALAQGEGKRRGPGNEVGKTLPFWGCTYPYSPYKRVAPWHYLTCAILKSNMKTGFLTHISVAFQIIMFTLVWSLYWLVPLIIVVNNQMMKFGKTSLTYTFWTNFCLAVYFKYNYSNWWLEAVQDEHTQKLCVA